MSLVLDQYTNQATGEGGAKLTFSVSVGRFPIDGLLPDEELRLMLGELAAKVQTELDRPGLYDPDTVRRTYERGRPL